MTKFAIHVLIPAIISILLVLLAITSPEVETKTFTAKCPLFVGVVTKQSDKFYNKHGKEIWLPLKECYLEEK